MSSGIFGKYPHHADNKNKEETKEKQCSITRLTDADVAKNCLDVAAIAERYEGIFDYNDNNGGHKGVQKLFTKAIKSAKQDEKEGAK